MKVGEFDSLLRTEPGLSFENLLDRIDKLAGTMRVVDYKTSKSSASVEQAATSVQLGFYAMAAGADPELAEHGPVSAAEFWYPAQHGAASLIRRHLDMERMDEVRAAMRGAADGIAAEDWTPQPGPRCERCRVRLVCSAWPEGREAYQT